MRITAVVEKGLIKLPRNVRWVSGTVVRIEPVDEKSSKSPKAAKRNTWPVPPPKIDKKESVGVMRRIDEQFGKVELDNWK